jgi:molecular chaperone IbpA
MTSGTIKLFNSEFPLTSPVGFDRVVDILKHMDAKYGTQSAVFPPYNIVKQSEFEYTIELAVAGYQPGDIVVESADGVLTIKSAALLKSQEQDDYPKYLHRGLAQRAFTRAFALLDTMEVVGAEMENGVLSIRINNKLPEHKYPKQHDIVVKKPKAVSK